MRTIRTGFSVLVVTSSVLAATVPSASVRALAAASGGARVDWPQYQGDAGHTGWDRNEPILNTTNVSQLVPRWIASLVGQVPVESGGLFFGGSPTNPLEVRAVSATTGQIAWTTQPVTSVGLPAPAVSGSLVLQPTADQGLYAFQAADGTFVYRTDDGPLRSAAATIGDHAYVVGQTPDERRGGLFAFHATNGHLESLRHVSPRFGISIPAVDRHRVYYNLGSPDPGRSRVVAFSPSGDRKIWTVQAPVVGTPLLTPVVSGDAVYVVAGGAVYDLDPRTGAIRWQTMNGGYGSLALAGSQLFATADFTGTVTELDAVTGSTGWTSATGGSTIETPPVVGGGVVFVASDDRIYAFDANDGSLLWVSISIGAPRATLAVFQGGLYAQTTQDKLWAFRLPGR